MGISAHAHPGLLETIAILISMSASITRVLHHMSVRTAEAALLVYVSQDLLVPSAKVCDCVKYFE